MSFSFEGNRYSIEPSDPSGGAKFPRNLRELAMSNGWSIGTSLLIFGLLGAINWILGLLIGVAFYAILFALRRRYQLWPTLSEESRMSTSSQPGPTTSVTNPPSVPIRNPIRMKKSETYARNKSLYYTILSALLAYNIWTSLVGREASATRECGSWLRPVLDDAGSPIGWFWSVGERECPQLIAGNLDEALFSAVLLGLLFGIQRLTRKS